MSNGSRYTQATLLTLGLVAVAVPRLLSQNAVPPWPYGYFGPASPGEVAPACTDPRRAVSCARPAAPVPDDGILRKLP
ncbi:MAG: hypothetical protein ACRD1Q_05000, partial [Vicinamibacterales bacterium]